MPNLTKKTGFYHQLHFLLKFMHSLIIKEQSLNIQLTNEIDRRFIYKDL
jgi:hypothetical protein